MYVYLEHMIVWAKGILSQQSRLPPFELQRKDLEY